jgi:hypothetical protein
MIYIIDTNSFGVLKNYYPAIFESFWEKFDELVEDGRVTSVREVSKELNRREDSEHLTEWIEENSRIFSPPTEDELEFVSQIFSVQHFQQLIGEKQLLKGYPVADPFLIAKAGIIEGGCVITEEKLKPHAAKIPNVCSHFNIDCTNIQGMLERENWNL